MNDKHENGTTRPADATARPPTPPPTSGEPPVGATPPTPPGERDTAIVLAGIEEMLIAVPYLIGFTPQRCLLALALAGEMIETATHAALPVWDLPPAVAALVEAFAPVRPEAVTLIGYGDAGSVEPRLATVASGLPWPVRHLIRVHRGHWWSLPPSPGRPAPAGRSAPPVRRRPLAHRPDLVADLQATFGPPAPTPPEGSTAPGADAGGGPDPDTARTRARVRDHLAALPPRPEQDLYRAVLAARRARRYTRSRPDPGQAAVLLQAVGRIEVHDACAAWAADDSALNLWLDLLSVAPAGWVTPVARLLALTAYRRGDHALAHRVLALALHDTPDDSCAHVIARCFLLGIHASDLTALLIQGGTDPLNPLPE